MYTSNRLLTKIREFEGCRLEAYQDAAGVWTIGYGHTRDVRKGDKISLYWAGELLKRDIDGYEFHVMKLGVCKTQGQLDALVSFAYNVGLGRLRNSTLLKLIKAGASEAEIRCQFMRWVYADGKKLNGLIARREWEADRFFTEGTPTIEELEAQRKEEEV